MATADILLIPIGAGLLIAAALPFTGHKWGGAFVLPAAVAAVLLASIEFAAGFGVEDLPEIGPGSARWLGNAGAIAILLANAASLIITKRALKRSGRGLPYQF